MNYLVIGNIVMLLGSLLMVVAGLAKTKKTAIVLQTAQIAIMSIGAIFLGSITGAIVNMFSCTRNILAYKDKMSNFVKVMLIVVSTSISLTFNNIGWVGFMPIICFILYTLYMDTKNIYGFKILVIAGCILFLVHDLYIKSYTSAVFDIFTIVTNVVSIFLLVRDSKKIHKEKAVIN